MKKEIVVFLTAVMFFTRIPCPKGMDYSQDILNASAGYYPVIGWIVGGFAGLVFYCAYLIFPFSISILLSMVATILLTGAFHEDGFADVCDGFGGGWHKKEILDIMKDSRIGAYGAIGLIAVLSCKFLALSAINASFIPIILIIGHSLSRFISSIFRFTDQYVRDNDDSKVKPMAKEMSVKNLALSAVFGLLPLLLLKNIFAFALVIPVLIAELLFARYSVRRIGGYTGDCLGAAQQLCEVVFYLSFIGFWQYTIVSI
jgi:adenosylcobinamide-GDP ribazoletransferase